LLKSHFPPRTSPDPTIARFDHVCSIEGRADDLEPLKAFMSEAILNKCEGVMVKVLDHDVEALRVRREEEDAAAEIVDVLSETEEAAGNDETLKDEEEEVPEQRAVKRRRKPLLSSYECDKRAESWLKWCVLSHLYMLAFIFLIHNFSSSSKRDYGVLGDSLDLVPVGAWHGSGRKAGWWCVETE
jgi:DNA ligase-1